MPTRKTRRKTTARPRSLRAQKNAIWKSSDWITRGLDFCIGHGRWQEWEDRLLTALRLNVSHDLDSALTYSFQVLKDPWPAFEPILADGVAVLDGLAIARFLSPFVRYVRYHQGSSSLKTLILSQGLASSAFVYAVYGTRTRWRNAEHLVLKGPHLRSPALGLGPVDVLYEKKWIVESQAVSYARLFFSQGWPALEKKMATGNCHPRIAYEYAVNILQGPLPQAIETWLTLSVFDADGNEFRQKYVAFTTAKKGQPSQVNSGSSPSTP